MRPSIKHVRPKWVFLTPLPLPYLVDAIDLLYQPLVSILWADPADHTTTGPPPGAYKYPNEQPHMK